MKQIKKGEIDFEKQSFEALYLLCDASLQFQSSTICEVLCNVWPVLLTRCSKEERLLVVVSTALAIARISGEPLLHCAAASTILGVTLAFLWTLQWFKHKKKNMTQLLKSLELFRKKLLNQKQSNCLSNEIVTMVLTFIF